MHYHTIGAATETPTQASVTKTTKVIAGAAGGALLGHAFEQPKLGIAIGTAISLLVAVLLDD